MEGNPAVGDVLRFVKLKGKAEVLRGVVDGLGINRKSLQPRLDKGVFCSGMVEALAYVVATFGYETGGDKKEGKFRKMYEGLYHKDFYKKPRREHFVIQQLAFSVGMYETHCHADIITNFDGFLASLRFPETYGPTLSICGNLVEGELVG